MAMTGTAGLTSHFAVGPLQFDCTPAGLRHIRFGQVEVLSAVQVVIRDPNWGTLPGEVVEASVPRVAEDGSVRRWHVRHGDGQIDFDWWGLVQARSSGPHEAELSIAMEGSAHGDFLANRIGFCLLHPTWLAGKAAQARQGDLWVAGRFPLEVAPHQPLKDFVGLRHPLPAGGSVEISLTGGVFEMEDQRNWTDASFKTYCPPLALPYPRQFRAGERVAQNVTVRISRPPDGGSAPAPPLPILLAAGDATRPVSVRLEQRQTGRLPAIGVGLAPPMVPVSEAEHRQLQAVRPAHLHSVIDLASPAWSADLLRGLNEAADFGCPVDFEIVAADPAELAEAAAAIRESGASRRSIGRIFVYDRATSQTSQEFAAAWAEAGSIPPSGGSRADFAQLNRADLPAELLHAVTFAVSPQVHVTDEESMMETLTAQPVVARSAIAIARGRPVVVGPITLKPRFNPEPRKSSETSPKRPLPDDVDPRQAAALTAAWTLGSIAALAPAGAAALTYFETAGAKGLIAGSAPLPPGFPEPGMSYPVYHVLALMAPLAGQALMAARSEDPAKVAVLAVATEPVPLVVLANLRPEPVTVQLAAQAGPKVRLRRLPTSPTAPVTQAEALSADIISSGSQGFIVELEPWQVVSLGEHPQS